MSAQASPASARRARPKAIAGPEEAPPAPAAAGETGDAAYPSAAARASGLPAPSSPSKRPATASASAIPAPASPRGGRREDGGVPAAAAKAGSRIPSPKGVRKEPAGQVNRSTAAGRGGSPVRRPGGKVPLEELGKPDTIKVCMRVRPLSAAEVKRGEEQVLMCTSQSPESLWLRLPGRRGEESKSTEHRFDWVLPGETSQARVHEVLGPRIVQGVVNGYHGCVFAYGQTGSGKSHSIFGGSGESKGLLPRMVEDLFLELQKLRDKHIVRLSYLELYNECARDLLLPHAAEGPGRAAPPALEIRQHPKVGVFVEGLTSNAVESAGDVMRLIDFGNKIRVVGYTNMNAVSSRSHALVTLNVERVTSGASRLASKKQRALFHAVDLAGSERMKNSEECMAAQKEGRNINKSLLALNMMIQHLASKQKHIPYRESKLTYLLAESLMGNCRTVMLACASPALSCFSTTEVTLRFASSAKRIRTSPVKNEEAEGLLIEALCAEIESLKQQLHEAEESKQREIEDRLAAARSCWEFVGTSSWEAEHEKSTQQEKQRRKTLHMLGLSGTLAEGEKRARAASDVNDPFLVNECSDSLLAGCLKYRLPKGETVRVGSDPSCAVAVSGLGILPEMCSLASPDGRAVLLAVASIAQEGEQDRKAIRRGSLFQSRASPEVCVNGRRLTATCALEHGDKIRVGSTHIFKLVVPLAQQGRSSLPATPEGALAVELAEALAHMEERFGGQPAAALAPELQELHMMVEEANRITEELRGEEAQQQVFKVQVLSDALAPSVPPRLTVVLLRAAEGEGGLEDEASSPLELAAAWPPAKFRHRLEVLRDVYHEVSVRDSAWGRPGDLDPWADSHDVPVLINAEAKDSAEAEDAAAAGPEPPPAVPAPAAGAEAAPGQSAVEELPSSSELAAATAAGSATPEAGAEAALRLPLEGEGAAANGAAADAAAAAGDALAAESTPRTAAGAAPAAGGRASPKARSAAGPLRLSPRGSSGAQAERAQAAARERVRAQAKASKELASSQNSKEQPLLQGSKEQSPSQSSKERAPSQSSKERTPSHSSKERVPSREKERPASQASKERAPSQGKDRLASQASKERVPSQGKDKDRPVSQGPKERAPSQGKERPAVQGSKEQTPAKGSTERTQSTKERPTSQTPRERARGTTGQQKKQELQQKQPQQKLQAQSQQHPSARPAAAQPQTQTETEVGGGVAAADAESPGGVLAPAGGAVTDDALSAETLMEVRANTPAESAADVWIEALAEKPPEDVVEAPPEAAAEESEPSPTAEPAAEPAAEPESPLDAPREAGGVAWDLPTGSPAAAPAAGPPAAAASGGGRPGAKVETGAAAGKAVAKAGPGPERRSPKAAAAGPQAGKARPQSKVGSPPQTPRSRAKGEAPKASAAAPGKQPPAQRQPQQAAKAKASSSQRQAARAAPEAPALARPASQADSAAVEDSPTRRTSQEYVATLLQRVLWRKGRRGQSTEDASA